MLELPCLNTRVLHAFLPRSECRARPVNPVVRRTTSALTCLQSQTVTVLTRRVPALNRSISVHMAEAAEPKLSIKQMKESIREAGLPTADLLERADIDARYAEAVAHLADWRAATSPTTTRARPGRRPRQCSMPCSARDRSPSQTSRPSSRGKWTRELGRTPKP